MKNNNLYENKTVKDNIWKWVSFSLACFLMILFILVFVFIIISSIPGFEAYGIKNIFGTTEFLLAKEKAGIWSPIAITLLLTFGAVLIATPIGIKTATFIKFRLSIKYQKTASIIVQALNGIPSVIFGLFALNSLGWIVKIIFGVENGAYSIINAMIMLSFMVLPTITSLTLNAYNNISNEMLTNPISLGTTKTYAIYKVYKKEAKNPIIVAVIVAIGRAFGETMALSMILTSESYNIIGEGLGATLISNLGSLGSIIATNMFSETGGEGLRGVLYVFGIVLFIFVIIFNAIILFITKKHSTHFSAKIYRIQNFISDVIMWAPNNILCFCSNLFIDKKQNPNINLHAPIGKYIELRCNNHKLKSLHCWWWCFWEYLCTFLTFGFLTWISLDIIIGGAQVIFRPYNNSPEFNGYNSTLFSYSLNTTGQAFVNTLIIIFVSLLISLPIALMIAIYLNEYVKHEKFKKTVLFFVDCLGSSPSIIFGMFGLAVFIELLGISLNGQIGRSLLAGALTISIVILPSLIRTLQQALAGVPMIVRINAYSLGCTKWETIWKVVMRHAVGAMMSSIILAIGRIMAETAPLYLTAGLTSVSGIGLMLPGQTLTTRIYAQLSSNNLESATSIQYECAIIALIIVIFLIWVGNYIVPNWTKIKNNVIDKYWIIKNIFFYSNPNILKKYQSQIINHTLYLSKSQAVENMINSKRLKLMYANKKWYLIKIIKQENLIKLKDEVFVKMYDF